MEPEVSVGEITNTIESLGPMQLKSCSLRALLRWLWEANVFIGTLALLLGAVFISLRQGATEASIRMTGLALQLIGMTVVIRNLLSIRICFHHKLYREVWLDWFRRAPFIRRNVVLSLSGAAAIGGTGKARFHASFSATPGAGLEDRVRALEKNLEAIRERIASAEADIDRNHREATQSMKRLEAAIRKEIEEMGEANEDIQTKDIPFSVAGSVCLFAGILLSSSAPELEWLVSRIW